MSDLLRLMNSFDRNLSVPWFSIYKMWIMPAPLPGVLGRKFINFLKRSSTSRNSTTGDPMKKFESLAIREAKRRVHEGALDQAVSNTDGVSITVWSKGKPPQIQEDVKSRMHFPNLKDLIFQPQPYLFVILTCTMRNVPIVCPAVLNSFDSRCRQRQQTLPRCPSLRG